VSEKNIAKNQVVIGSLVASESSGRQRGLTVAVEALQKRPRAQVHWRVLETANRSDKTLQPKPLLMRLFALLLGPILLEKISQTQDFLKLNRVLFHHAPPESCVFSKCSP
jgi:hypothetical protein